MTKTVELDVAQATLRELVAALPPGEEVVIVQENRPVAKLISSAPAGARRVPG